MIHRTKKLCVHDMSTVWCCYGLSWKRMWKTWDKKLKKKKSKNKTCFLIELFFFFFYFIELTLVLNILVLNTCIICTQRCPEKKRTEFDQIQIWCEVITRYWAVPRGTLWRGFLFLFHRKHPWAVGFVLDRFIRCWRTLKIIFFFRSLIFKSVCA